MAQRIEFVEDHTLLNVKYEAGAKISVCTELVQELVEDKKVAKKVKPKGN